MPTPSVVSVTPVGQLNGDVDIVSNGASETVTYRVVFDGPGSTMVDAIFASTDSDGSVPAFGDARGFLVLTSKTASMNRATALEWTVQCKYVLPVPGQEAKPEGASLWAVRIDGSSVPYEVSLQTQADGTRIVNTAGDFIENITDEAYDEEIVVTFSSTSIDFGTLQATKGKVNSDTVTMTINGVERVFNPNCMKLVAYTYSFIWDVSGVSYPRITLHLKIRDVTWIRQVPNMGYRKLVGENLVLISATATTPYALNDEGTDVLAEGDPMVTIPVTPQTQIFTGLLDGIGT
jgi:hypothetical protein